MTLAILLGGVFFAFMKRKDFLRYQLILLASFLAALTLSGELGNTMPVYAVAALVPCLLRCREYASVTLVFCLAMGLYLLMGIIQSPVEAITTFICRIAQFFGLIFVVGGSYSEPSSRDCEKIVQAGLAIEVLLAGYLVSNGTMAGGGDVEGIRLVANSQPITGNLAIALLPLLGYLFFRCYEYNPAGRLRVMFYASCFLSLCVLSGTRGYVLMFGLCYAVLFFFFVWDAATGKLKSRAPYLIISLGLTLLFCLVAAFQKELFQLVADVLRVDDSLGIRDYENVAVIETYVGMPNINKVTGIGLGGRWADIPAFVDTVIKRFPLWARDKYLLSIGTAVHNFFSNVLVLQGALGIVLILLVAGWLLSHIRHASLANKPMRVFLYAFVVGYAAMLYFRWSADCGVGVLVFLGYTVQLLSQESAGLPPGPMISVLTKNGDGEGYRMRRALPWPHRMRRHSSGSSHLKTGCRQFV